MWAFLENRIKKLVREELEKRLEPGAGKRDWNFLTANAFFLTLHLPFQKRVPVSAFQDLRANPTKKNISRPLYLLRYGVNLSILLTPGKEIKRDSASSGERRRKRSKEKGVLV